MKRISARVTDRDRWTSGCITVVALARADADLDVDAASSSLTARGVFASARDRSDRYRRYDRRSINRLDAHVESEDFRTHVTDSHSFIHSRIHDDADGIFFF
jgi:hypothetical protein